MSSVIETVVLAVLYLLCIVGGAITLYVAMFSYESEDEKIQGALETWWIKLSDTQDSIWSRLKTTTSQAGELSADFIERWLGSKIRSARFLSTSIVISFGPACLMIGAFFDWAGVLISIPISIALIWAAFRPIKTGKPPYKLAALLLLLCLSPFLLPLLPTYHDDWHHVLAVSLLFSIFVNVYATAIVRSLLRILSRKSPITLVFIAPVAVTAGVLLLSFASIFALGPFSWLLVPLMSIPAVGLATLPLFILGGLLCTAAMIHVLGRGLYSAQRHKIVSNKKLLWTLAIGQLSVVPVANKLASALKL